MCDLDLKSLEWKKDEDLNPLSRKIQNLKSHPWVGKLKMNISNPSAEKIEMKKLNPSVVAYAILISNPWSGKK